MSTPGFRSALAVLLVLTLPLHAASPAWLKLETDEFVIYSDAREKDVIESAIRYAAFRRVFDDFFVPVGGSLPTSMLILFRTEKAFHAHVPDTRERNRTTVNFSIEVDGAPLTAFAVSGDPGQALGLTSEFETIWGLKRLGYHVPVWASQGAGGLLAEIDVLPGQIVVGDLGRRGNDSMPWPRFFETGQSSDAYHDAYQLADFLAQTRKLMHWILLKDDSTRSRFIDLALRLRTAAGIEAVAAAMDTPASEFDKAIRQHLRDTQRRTLVFDQQAVLAGFRIGPAPEPEVLVHTAELLVATGRFREADANLDRARDLSPEHPAVKEAWARRLLRERRTHEAIELYREAIAAGSRNFTAYMRSAEARLNEAQTGGQDLPGEGGVAAEQAADELRHAIRLNPGSADAYRLLGRALFVSPNLTSGDLEQFDRGVFQGESGHPVRLYRAALHRRLGEIDEAIAELRSLIAEPDIDPHNRQIAERNLAIQWFERDTKEVEAHVKAKNYAAAHQLIVDASAAPEREIAADNYRRLAEWVQESEAWAVIAEHALAGRKEELRAAAKAFLERFPNSKQAAEAWRLAQLPR